MARSSQACLAPLISLHYVTTSSSGFDRDILHILIVNMLSFLHPFMRSSSMAKSKTFTNCTTESALFVINQ